MSDFLWCQNRILLTSLQEPSDGKAAVRAVRNVSATNTITVKRALIGGF